MRVRPSRCIVASVYKKSTSLGRWVPSSFIFPARAPSYYSPRLNTPLLSHACATHKARSPPLLKPNFTPSSRALASNSPDNSCTRTQVPSNHNSSTLRLPYLAYSTGSSLEKVSKPHMQPSPSSRYGPGLHSFPVIPAQRVPTHIRISPAHHDIKSDSLIFFQGSLRFAYQLWHRSLEISHTHFASEFISCPRQLIILRRPESSWIIHFTTHRTRTEAPDI